MHLIPGSLKGQCLLLLENVCCKKCLSKDIFFSFFIRLKACSPTG